MYRICVCAVPHQCLLERICVCVCPFFLCLVHGNRKIQCNHLYLSLIHPVDYFFPFSFRLFIFVSLLLFLIFICSISFYLTHISFHFVSFRLCSFCFRLRFPFESISSKRALITFAFLYKRKYTHTTYARTHIRTHQYTHIIRNSRIIHREKSLWHRI